MKNLSLSITVLIILSSTSFGYSSFAHEISKNSFPVAKLNLDY
ncbi:hypothetical protein [Francisella sp. LA112445]|nr:hypothetical protein [Francisella sp. LA112445]